MDVNTIIHFWPVLTLLGYLIMGWLLWHLSKSFVSRKEHETLRSEVKSIQETVDGVQVELRNLRGSLNNLPSTGEVNQILLGLEEVRGTQRELVATMRGQDEVLKRIEHPVQLLMAAHMEGGAHR